MLYSIAYLNRRWTAEKSETNKAGQIIRTETAELAARTAQKAIAEAAKLFGIAEDQIVNQTPWNR